MKKALFLIVFFSVCISTLIYFTGCAGQSEKKDEPTDIWDLLIKGDSRAKDYFVGEFDVNSRNKDGKTPLHYAAERGDEQLAAFFISLGADVNALDHDNVSPLAISIEKNDARITELLVNAKADIHLPVKENTTAVKLALAPKCTVSRYLATPYSVSTTDNEGKTILHIASMEGHVQMVKDILTVLPSSGVSVDKKDNAGKKAIDYAFARPDSKNHMEVAEQLILASSSSDSPIFNYFAPAVRIANYNIRRTDGFAPIHFAVSQNYQGLIDLLLEKNIDINIKSTSGSTPLHEAARTGNINVMKLLIGKGAEVNATDAKGNTPLHMGTPANVHNEAITLLLESGANPNLRDEHGDTPLHIVITLGRPIDVIQTLLGKGSDVFVRNIDGKTPLYIAIQEKRTDIIPLLLTYGSEVFASDNNGVTPFALAIKDSDSIFELLVTPDTVNQRDGGGNTMLHNAVRNRGNSRHVNIILNHRPLVDARNREGDTALHIAVRMNHREIGEFLLSRDASIFSANALSESPLYYALTASTGIRQWMINPITIAARDGLGNSMLHYAAQWNLEEAIPIIIQRGISVEDKNATGETPLFMATKTNSPATIRTLIMNHADMNATDNQGNTLLHTAVRWNAINAARLLIAAGINVDAHSLNGITALHSAVILGMPEIESLLIREGANLEVRDVEGNTPFMEAVKSGNIPSIQKLAANGADTNTRNIRGDTPLHLSVAMERYDLSTLLLRMGASIHARNTMNRTPFQNAITTPRMAATLLTKDRINQSDDMGKSPLHIALEENAIAALIKVIIERGGRINAVDSNGKTPLRIAMDLDMFEAAKILADAGADPFFTAVDNKSPADIAFAKGKDHVKAIFSGAAINARDTSANTALHLAARFATPEIITTLLELGANKSSRNISSEVPVDVAVKWNRDDNAAVLR